jgi:hypothetical protein
MVWATFWAIFLQTHLVALIDKGSFFYYKSEDNLKSLRQDVQAQFLAVATMLWIF